MLETSESVIPKIISVDDHVVEPRDVWVDRLPKRYRDVGPRIVYEPQGDMSLVDGAWVEKPGHGDKLAAWWHFEDHRYQIKQMIACAGMAPEDRRALGISDSLIRVSVGLEAPEDLTADFDAALKE